MQYIGLDYKLASETRELLAMVDISRKELQNSVKTNYYFLATTSAKELFHLLSHLKHLKFYNKSRFWINELIKMIEPQIIICEGKTTFDKLVEDNKCKVIINGKVLYTEINGLPVIGYRRKFSNIQNKEAVALKLKEVYNNSLRF